MQTTQGIHVTHLIQVGQSFARAHVPLIRLKNNTVASPNIVVKKVGGGGGGGVSWEGALEDNDDGGGSSDLTYIIHQFTYTAGVVFTRKCPTE